MSWSLRPIASLVTRSALAKPATRLYPTVRRTPYARTRGHIEFRIDNCNFCTICAHKCPTQAIQVHRQNKTWAIDHSRCILCGLCVEGCQNGCITLSATPYPPMSAKEIQRFRQEYEPGGRVAAEPSAVEVG
ncbi:MAG: 4Fe-4S binding protein [Thermochromatium sp.]